MVKKLSFFIFLFFLIIFSGQFAFGKISAREKFSQDEVIVKLKPQYLEATMEQLNNSLGIQVKERMLFSKMFVLKVPEKKVKQFVSLLSQNPLFEYVEPNYEATVLETTNDPSLSKQWGLFKIQAASSSGESGWDKTHGSSSIKIAIVDTGIDTNHEDLSSKVTVWKNFTSGPGSSKTTDDKYGHGTHVAGIAAAITNNLKGVAGTGYNSSLMSIKVLNDSGSGSYSWIANGIKWAADNGAKVINMSIGGYGDSQTLLDAVNYAWDKGVVIVAAAGNDNITDKLYPCAYEKVICVAATDDTDSKAYFSNYDSTWVDVAAPGLNIFSTFPNHSYKINKARNYDYGSGTSMATPFVSGLAGLLWSGSYGVDSNAVRQRIEETCDPISGTGSYWAKGRINLYKGVSGGEVTVTPTVAAPTNTPPPSTPTPTPKPTNTPMPTLIPTSSPITPTPTPPAGAPTPTPTPWWCSRWPWLCQ